MDAQELRNLQEAYLDVYQELDEAEGSYGQTPTARKAYGDLANKRRATPASGFAKRGDKKSAVTSAQKHFDRTGNPDAGNRGKKSTKPSFHSGARKGMTQSDRDDARGEAEYGHTGYDPSFDGPPSAPGGKPKGKKLERQRKTGVSAESYDLYDIILSHLLDEGYAETVESAEAIMVNMSEDWRDSIVEEVLDEELTGARRERAQEKIAALGKKKSTLDQRSSISRVIRGREGANPGTKLPTKRGGDESRGLSKASWAPGYQSDRGSGNKAARRMGRSVQDTRGDD